MAANGGIIRGIYTGEEEPEGTVVFEDGEEVPIRLPHVTHFSVDEAMTVIPRRAFCHHPKIVELNCNNVRTIDEEAFAECPSLERLIMPGVEEVKRNTFSGCEAIRHIECDKLEIIRGHAFLCCVSLNYIDLPSAKSVEYGAFTSCEVLRYVNFGKSLESFGEGVFFSCRALERITIPLKNGLIEHDNTFTRCEMLNRVDLFEAAKIQEIVAALLLEEWRQDMCNLIDSINQILPNTSAGRTSHDVGGKARVIRGWIVHVLRKIIYYKAQHRCLLNEASSILKLDLPNDIVHNNVLAFLELPSHTFDGEDEDNDSMVLS